MAEDILSTNDLPSAIPVFPLPSVILLPGSNLPLNIFEPRYLQMVKAARAGSGIIGMVQPQDPEDVGTKPALFDIGGAGRITHYAKTEDGRNIIRLTGLCRFKVEGELQVMTPYRQVQANWQAYKADITEENTGEPIEREALTNALKAYLDRKGLEADYDGINTAPDNVLINTLSMIIPFGVPEKQALLEALDVPTRAETLKSLLIMLTEATQSEPTRRPS